MNGDIKEGIYRHLDLRLGNHHLLFVCLQSRFQEFLVACPDVRFNKTSKGIDLN